MFLHMAPVLFASWVGAITEVSILEHRFDPDSVRIQPGDTVRWTHVDAAAHTVTSADTGIRFWDSGYMAYGDVYLRVFPAAGVQDYLCLYHPMNGRVFVGGATGIQFRSGPAPAAKPQGVHETHGTPRDLRGRALPGPGNSQKESAGE